MKPYRTAFYLGCIQYTLRRFITRKEQPFIGGIAINDRCNLRCLHCSVSNRNIPDMTFEEIKEGFHKLREKGIRSLYIEGGEPFLWRDGQKSLEDVIRLARESGFYFITLYTNGTFPVETSADTVFISLDGTMETNDALRGKSYERVMENIHKSHHRKMIINCTLSKTNKDNLEAFCESVGEEPGIKGIFFYFYTPLQESDPMSLERREKEDLVRRILRLKHLGYPVVNSGVALKSALEGTWKRPNGLGYLYAGGNLYKCCRFIGNETACRECGYLGFPEIYHITRFHPVAILTAFNYL